MLIDEAYQKDPENMAAFRHHPEQFWETIGAENLEMFTVVLSVLWIG
jgi:probable phosphoglycerate mutase